MKRLLLLLWLLLLLLVWLLVRVKVGRGSEFNVIFAVVLLRHLVGRLQGFWIWIRIGICIRIGIITGSREVASWPSGVATLAKRRGHGYGISIGALISLLASAL